MDIILLHINKAIKIIFKQKYKGKGMKQLLKAWIFGFGLLLIWVPSAIARHGAHSEEANQILQKAEAILISNDYCKNTRDCHINDFMFTDADDISIGASFYKINDQKTINQIIALYSSAYFEHNRKIDIAVTFSHFSHSDDSWYKNADIKLSMKGIKK